MPKSRHGVARFPCGSMNSFSAPVGIAARSVIWHRNGRLIGVLVASTFIDGRA